MKQITSIIVFISITFLIYGLYNCNCNKNKSYEKFELNSNNPTFLNIINKNMNNIQNISNFNKKLLKNITNSNFNLNKNIENFIDINKITPQDINGLNQIIKNILAGKDKDGNYDINNINIQLNNIKTQLDNFLSQQQTEHQTITNSINSSMSNLKQTNDTLLLQKANIMSLQGNQTLFNDIEIITAVPTRLPNMDETIITTAPTMLVNITQPPLAYQATLAPLTNTTPPPSSISVNTIQQAITDNTLNKQPSSISVDTTQKELADSTIITEPSTSLVDTTEPELADSTVNIPLVNTIKPPLTDSTTAADTTAADKTAADTTAADTTAADSESFSNFNQPSPYNNNLILTNFLPLNKNKKIIESHKIIIKQNKNLFNNLPKSIKMNDFQRCQPDWQLEWAENLRQIRI
jgi:hypothetical protein